MIDMPVIDYTSTSITIPQCMVDAAQRYQIPLRVLVAVQKSEGGKLGQRVKNKNGTYDHGPFQINTIWLDKFSKFGYTEDILTNNFCASAYASSYIIRYYINDAGGDFWKGVGNYNSKTPVHHNKYVLTVYKNSLF